MSFYIKVNNPKVHKSVAGAHVCGSPVEGTVKTALVTAFTPVVGDPKATHVPDRQNANKDLSWVSVSLAEQEPVALPFTSDEFEELVLAAQKDNRISDFTSAHWSDRLHELVAVRAARHPSVG